MADALIPVVVAGATGRIGQAVVRTVLSQVDMELVGALGHARHLGDDIGDVVVGEPCGVSVSADLDEAFENAAGGVLVDVSNGEAVKDTVLKAMESNVACVVGTSNIPKGDEDEIFGLARVRRHPLLIAPNFALGAVLMMKFATMAAKYYRWAEIIEAHHERKMDAPSGTARRTAEMMLRARKDGFRSPAEGEEAVKGVRGGNVGGIRIHSVRMPGFLASQEVILGGVGETLHLRHSSETQESFMSGVVLAIQKVRSLDGLVIGLENLLSEDTVEGDNSAKA